MDEDDARAARAGADRRVAAAAVAQRREQAREEEGAVPRRREHGVGVGACRSSAKWCACCVCAFSVCLVLACRSETPRGPDAARCAPRMPICPAPDARQYFATAGVGNCVCCATVRVRACVRAQTAEGRRCGEASEGALGEPASACVCVLCVCVCAVCACVLCVRAMRAWCLGGEASASCGFLLFCVFDAAEWTGGWIRVLRCGDARGVRGPRA